MLSQRKSDNEIRIVKKYALAILNLKKRNVLLLANVSLFLGHFTPVVKHFGYMQYPNQLKNPKLTPNSIGPTFHSFFLH